MRFYNQNRPIISYALPSTKACCICIAIALLSVLARGIGYFISFIPQGYIITYSLINQLVKFFYSASWVFLIATLLIFLAAVVMRLLMKPHYLICHQVKKGLLCYSQGNPLHLKDCERIPKITCKQIDEGVYELTISASCRTCEELLELGSSISSALNKRFNQYAVTLTSSDIAFNSVTFRIEDVTIDRSLTFNDVSEMKPDEPTKLKVQQGTEIDLTTSGSILVAGKTRSGKTTAIISLLISALQCGRDNYNSEVIIIDPKQAELSRLPHVVTLDEDGEAKGVLKAMQDYCDTIVKRQQILNDLSEQKGDAVKWWDAGMHVSFLFVEEYVSLRSLFPSKPSKADPDYCLATFDGLLKRIVTMGASAGCYVIISIAEASVSEGGLPAMLRSAMTTKILFKPTVEEARLIWDSDKLKDFNNGRVYNAGDAWFSSTDGKHDNVSYVHFPNMKFKVYAELGRLLNEYYS